ncbi:MAG: transglycosylase domain-containing protein, partial [candidate division NC10 bacterium]|nr:transglycosylase domain-containing protein [candidate division NC10 bacterium]
MCPLGFPAPQLRRVLALAVTLAVLLGAPPVPIFGFIADPEKDLPFLDKLEIFQPGEPSILYSDQNEPFGSLAPEFRIFVPLGRVPNLVQQAILDAEDAQFYRHGAISLKGMARAAIRNLAAARLREGGSTITQQLAKSLFLSPERTLGRKIKEIQLAQEIERRYSKDKILEMYLNAIYFGGGAYGIEAAARKGVATDQIALEGALVALDPETGDIRAMVGGRDYGRSQFNRARARRDYVLNRMEKERHISASQARAAMRLPIALAPFFKGRGGAPSFVDFVRKELEPRFGRMLLTRGGLRIHTTLDIEMQRAATETLRRGIAETEKALAGKRKGVATDQIALEGALVALDPETGDIRAMVGGRD